MTDLNGTLSAAFDPAGRRLRLYVLSSDPGAATRDTPDANATGRSLDSDRLKVVFV